MSTANAMQQDIGSKIYVNRGLACNRNYVGP